MAEKKNKFTELMRKIFVENVEIKIMALLLAAFVAIIINIE